MTENEFRELKRKVEENKILTLWQKQEIIQALEEIQQYRAIGTLSEIRSVVKCYFSESERLATYERIGTIDEFKALKEKSEPKEPIIIDNRFNEVEWKCPVCGLNVIEEPPCQEYCQRCGNKLDWSE